MQTVTNNLRLISGQMKILILVFGIACAVIVAALLIQTQSHDTAVVNSDERTLTIHAESTPNTRFLERNLMPIDTSEASVISLKEYRFRDWNTILPASDGALVPPSGERGQRH